MKKLCVTVTVLTDDASRFAYTKLKSGGVLLMFFGCEIIDKHFSCYSCQKVTVKGNVHGRKSKVSSSPSKNFSIFYLTLTVSMARALHTVNCYYCFIFTFSSCFLPFFQFSRGFSIEPPGQPLDHHPRDFPTIFVQRC